MIGITCDDPLGAALAGSYDHLQVSLSVLIAVAASYTPLDLAGRVTAASGWASLGMADRRSYRHGNWHLGDALCGHARLQPAPFGELPLAYSCALAARGRPRLVAGA